MQGILFFNHGTKHLVRLLVSLSSLRKVSPEVAVTIIDTGESGGIAAKVAAALAADIITIPFVPKRRHSCYCMKSTLWRHSPYDVSLLVDSDTIFAESPKVLLDIIAQPRNPGFLVTRFSDWVTTGDIIKSRLKQWQGIVARPRRGGHIFADDLLAKSFRHPHAAINTGVIGWRNDAESFSTLCSWEALTNTGWRCSLTDELAAQLIIRKFPHTMVSNRYNCSCIYGKEKANAVIHHFHGNKCLREECRDLWLPTYNEVLKANLADVANWQPAGDPALTEYLAAQNAA